MFKFFLIQFFYLLLLSIASLFTGVIIGLLTKNDNIGISTWLLLQIITITYFLFQITKPKKNNTHQIPRTQSNQNTVPLSKSNYNVPLNKEIVIEYSSSKGSVTTRKILVHELKYVKKSKNLIPYAISAYCFVKKAPRTFIIDRILSAYDANTGEVIDDVPSYLTK